MTSKSAAWFILSGALSTLVVAITCIFIAKSRKSVLGAVFTRSEDLHLWAIRVATLVATLGGGSGSDGTSLPTPLGPLDCGGCSLNQLLGINATSMVQPPL